MLSASPNLKNVLHNLNVNFRQLFQPKSLNHLNEITCINIQPPSKLHKAFNISITNFAPGCHSNNHVANYLMNFLDIKLTIVKQYDDLQKMEFSIVKNDLIPNQSDFVVCWNASCILEYDNQRILDKTEFCQLSFTDDMKHWIQLPAFKNYCRLLLPIIPCVKRLTNSTLCWGISRCPCQNQDDTCQSPFSQEKKNESAASLGIISRRSDSVLTKNTSETMLESLNTTPILSCHTLMTEANMFSMETIDFQFRDDIVDKILSVSSSHNVQHQNLSTKTIPLLNVTPEKYAGNSQISINSTNNTNIHSEIVDSFLCTEKTEILSFILQPILKCYFTNKSKAIRYNSFLENVSETVLVNKDIDINDDTTFHRLLQADEKTGCSSVLLDGILFNDSSFCEPLKKSISDSCLCMQNSLKKKVLIKTNIPRVQISCVSSGDTFFPTLISSTWYIATLENFTFHPYNIAKSMVHRQSQLRCNIVSCGIQMGGTHTSKHLESEQSEVYDNSPVFLESIKVEDTSFDGTCHDAYT
jgi:hypothetical protein